MKYGRKGMQVVEKIVVDECLGNDVKDINIINRGGWQGGHCLYWSPHCCWLPGQGVEGWQLPCGALGVTTQRLDVASGELQWFVGRAAIQGALRRFKDETCLHQVVIYMSAYLLVIFSVSKLFVRLVNHCKESWCTCEILLSSGKIMIHVEVVD